MKKNILEKRRVYKSFTLIELLIVVAIIGILLTLLLPSLSNARQASLRAVCLSNMKGYGTAAQLYLANNGNKFPGHFNPLDVHQGRSWIGKKGAFERWSLDVTERPLNKYMGLTEDGIEAPQVKCPFNDLDIDVYHKVGSSYMGNDYGGWQSLGNRFASEINNPSKVILSSEYGAMAFMAHQIEKLYRQTHYIGKPRYPFLKIDGTATHYTIMHKEGIQFESANLILNLKFDK